MGPSEVAIGRGLLVHTAEIGLGGMLCAAENSGNTDSRLRSQGRDTTGDDRMHTYMPHRAPACAIP